jgi:hypothetical protein
MGPGRLIAIFVAVFVSIFFPMFAALFAAFDSEKRTSAAKDRRLAEHKMNARLLRLDI